MVDYWYSRYPLGYLTKSEVEESIVSQVIDLIQLKGEPLPGVEQAIAFVESKDVKVALASSSSTIIIQAATAKTWAE